MELQADTAFSYTHLFVPCDSFTPKVLSELKEKFTIRSKYELPDGGRTTSILYKEVVSSSSGIRYFGLPRYHGLQLIAPVDDKTTLGHSIKFSMQDDAEHPMYAKQQRVLDVFRESIANGNTGVVLVLPTGAGKTCVGIKFICHLGKTALVIVPKDDLVQQWINRITSLTDIKREEIGIIKQDKCEYKGKKIVIGMMHSLALRKKPYPKDMYSYFGVVVLDELHRTGSEKLGIVSSLFPSKYRIGLTATPKRTDGMEDVYRYTVGERWIGQAKDDMPKPTVLVKQYRIESGVLSSMRYIKNVINRRGRLNSLLAGCYERNKVLAAVILQSVKHNRQTVLMSDRTSQLDTIKQILLDNDIAETEIGIYKGGVKDTDREKIITQKSIVLATYGAMDLGTDAPNLSLLVMGTPRSNVIQIVGRIRRIAENKKPPVVYDLVDTFPDCERMFQSRMKDYKLMSADTVYL